MQSESVVGDFVTLRRGTTYKGPLVGKPGPALLGLGSIVPGGGFRNDYKTYGGECPPELMLVPGDLYVSLKGATKDGDMIGSVARVPNTVQSGRLTQDTVRLVFRERDSAFEHYLYWLLRTPDYRNYCAGRATGSAVAALSREDFLAYPVPPLTTSRRRVVDALENIEEKIKSNARAHSLIWELLATEYDQLKANTAAESELRAILRLEYGKSLPATSRIAGPVPVYGSNGVTGTHNAALIDGPNVIVGRKGSIGEVHWSHVASFPIDTTFYVVPTDDYPLLVCHFALRSAKLQDKNSDSAVPGLNREAALSTHVIAPSLEIAQLWAANCVPLLNELQHLEAEVELLSQLRDTFLPELLSDRIRVPEAA